MIIETKYNIGDVIHVVHTIPADAEMDQYTDEHYYYGPKKVVGISVEIRNESAPNIVYYVVDKANRHSQPVWSGDAYSTREDAEAEVKRREGCPCGEYKPDMSEGGEVEQ